MKNILKTVGILIIGALFITGCAGSSPEPFKTIPPKLTKVGSLSYKIYGNVGSATEIENFAIAIREASLFYKEKGFKYFRISNNSSNKIHRVISNMEDLVRYCYPSEKGKGSLEDKCNLSNEKGNIRLYITGYRDSEMEKYTWSTDQVLLDPLVSKYIKSGLKDFEDKTISFETTSNRKMYKYLKSK